MKEYKRLTEKLTILGKTGNILNCSNCDKKAQCKNVKNYRDICLRTAIERLAELEDKLENGTFIELPCKVGDNIYFETWEDNGNTSIGVKGHKVAGFEINAIINGKYGKTYIPIKAVGIDVFLTKAEAEEKLKALKGD